MHGKLAAASFIVAKPAFTWPDRKGGMVPTIGVADREEGCEHGAVLKGKRLDIGEGEWVPVVGVLRVTTYSPGTRSVNS